MKWALRFLLLFLAVVFISDSARTLSLTLHIPNVVPVVREVLLWGLFFWAMLQVSLLENRRLAFTLFGFIIFFCLYELSSALEDKFFPGLYYARIYAVPVVFYFGCYAAITRINMQTLNWLLSRIALLNILLMLVAFAEYACLQMIPSLQTTMFGPSRLATAWYISGGVYMRMGLPFTSPNALGAVCAMTALLAVVALVSDTNKRRGGFIQGLSLVLSLAGMLGSFSRSAMILFLGGLLMLLTLPGFRQGIWVRRIAIYSTVALFFGALVLIGLEVASDGYVSRWIALTAHGRDPSLNGHLDTFRNAYTNFNDYYLYGYTRGTVGPQAEMFGQLKHNVENSTLSLVYDQGVLMTMVYLLLYLFLLSSSWVNRVQLGVIIGFLLNAQALPEVFAMEIMCHFLFVYTVIGCMARHGFFDHLLLKAVQHSKTPLYCARTPRQAMPR